MNRAKLDRLTTSHRESPDTKYSYKTVESTKLCDGANTMQIYGIAALNDCDSDALRIEEISTDKDLVQSIVDVLNNYRIPYVHSLDVIKDLMDEQ